MVACASVGMFWALSFMMKNMIHPTGAMLSSSLIIQQTSCNKSFHGGCRDIPLRPKMKDIGISNAKRPVLGTHLSNSGIPSSEAPGFLCGGESVTVRNTHFTLQENHFRK